MKDQLLIEARSMQQELSTWRRKLHQMPELGTALPRTVSFVEEKLQEMGIPCQIYKECSCITAVIGRGERCFLLRSDMDGLPVKEESGEAFASENGQMHACGHDLHTSILLGAARLLKSHEQELKGQVKLLFQSGEETFDGAKAAIEAGVMENPHVDAAFAMHVAAAMPEGVVIYGPYPMASVYGFRIILEGKGAHGSMPQLGVDPINTGVHIYLALQELIAREISATEEAVLTIGRFEAGKASNVIPQQAVMEGTLRTFRPELRERLIQRIQELTQTVAAAYRTKAEIEIISDVPSVVCDEKLNEEILESIRQMDASIPLRPVYHVMGSEDFAFFTEKVSASYFCIGAGVEDRTRWTGQHNAHVVFNENSIPLGAAIYAKAAMDWLERRQ